MQFNKQDFKELYKEKYGDQLDWEKLNDFAQYVCEKQTDDIIGVYKEYSTSLDGTEFVNRPFLNSITTNKLIIPVTKSSIPKQYYGVGFGDLDDEDKDIF